MSAYAYGTETARAAEPASLGAPRRLAAFSTDVEDYFQAESLRHFCPRGSWGECEDRTVRNTDRLLAILDEAGVRGTFFILGWTAERHPDLVRRIAARHEVASHGFSHELVYRQTPEIFREDVRRARGVLQDLSGQPVLGYRAPSYTIVERTLWALSVLAEEGHQYDSSVFPIKRRKYGIPSAPRWPHRVPLPGGRTIVEFPLPTVRVGRFNLPATGGAYMRLLPYSFQRWAIAQFVRQSRPFVLTIHPWELDPGQPRYPVGMGTRITHYHNLEKTERRLKNLLGQTTFVPQSEVLREVGLLPLASH